MGVIRVVNTTKTELFIRYDINAGVEEARETEEKNVPTVVTVDKSSKRNVIHFELVFIFIANL